MSNILQSYSQGSWSNPKSNLQTLYNANNGVVVAEISSDGLDFKSMMEYARNVGGSNLRKFTIHDRARMLKALAFYLMERKDKYYKISQATGATKIDSWIDIEGGIGTLFTYASKARREMQDEKFYVDGNLEPLSKGGTFVGHHICVPLEGVAFHINAFNFPIWGMLEKISPSIIAGMPCIVKPASLTAFLTEAMFKDIIESKLLPEGALQLICGSVGDSLDYVTCQDVVTFTGSAHTGRKLKTHKAIVENSVRFNMEADSLNFCMLGLVDAPGTPEFDLFIKEVVREVSTKAGQKCTAIRRTIVPQQYVDDVVKALQAGLAKRSLGNTENEATKMGPLAGKVQVQDVLSAVAKIKEEASLVYGNFDNFDVIGGDKNSGAYFPAMLMLCDKPLSSLSPHEVEAFGPVTTILPYANADEAIEIVKLGKGSLVGSVFTSDANFGANIVYNTAAYHGRIMVVSQSSAGESTGHGSPMPQLVHGGPGRAGGGEELGGIRSVLHYMQRTAIQGSPTIISQITKQYQTGADRTEDVRHPFTKYYEELQVGDLLTTHRRTVTETDIVNFTGISWDNFYAHTDTTSIAGSIFERRVAHGYFIISAAAGLFVNPKPGPVLANYGLDELRFIKPVYAGDTIYTKLTVKSKQEKEPREGEKLQGVVKWLVEVFTVAQDENSQDELAAISTILTLVERKG